MSKISPTLKALIESPHARPNTTPPPPYIRDVYTRILRQGKEKQYGLRPSIALAVRSLTLHIFPFNHVITKKKILSHDHRQQQHSPSTPLNPSSTCTPSLPPSRPSSRRSRRPSSSARLASSASRSTAYRGPSTAWASSGPRWP